MKKASIVSIGNELLSGRTVDTNTAYLGNKLLTLGIVVVSSYSVGDDVKRIVGAIGSAACDADIILITGGLGPTDDDLTRHGLAQYLDSELVFKKELLQEIEAYFKLRNRSMSENNKAQAYIPACSEPVVNDLGTAPGIVTQINDKLFICVPGVPSEMKQMIECHLIERIKAFAGAGSIVVKKLHCIGAGESTLAQMLGDLMQRNRNPLINCTVSGSCITLHIISSAEREDQALAMAQKDEILLRDILGELVFGSDEESLAEVVGKKLKEQKKTLSVAESCTGGLVSKLLTDIPGSSEYFNRGWVSYSNESKVTELNVPVTVIEEYGVVSKEVARAMASGAKEKSRSDYAIAITGIAGPGGGSDQKPVGLVYICVASDKWMVLKRFVFTNNRAVVRVKAALTALNLLRLKM